MTKQWNRQCVLTVQTGAKTQQALDLSRYRISFTVTQLLHGQPSPAEIDIYNLSREILSQIPEERQTVVLEAGYAGRTGVLFRGQLHHRAFGQQTNTETVLHISAADGGQAHDYGVVNTSLAAGNRPCDVHQALGLAFGQQGLELGCVPKLPDHRLPRGKVMYGMARDYAQLFADTHQLQWGYVNNAFVCVADNGIASSIQQATVMNTRSGLLGMPVRTEGGVSVTCLLNPEITVASIIKLENDDIQGQQSATTQTSGFYKVLKAIHKGDTRANDWYTSLECVDINADLEKLSNAASNAADNPS